MAFGVKIFVSPSLARRRGEMWRLASYAASLLREKVEKGQICSSTTEEKWMFAVRHIFGLLDDKGTLDVGIQGLGDIFVDKLTQADIEAWRDSWEPRINARKKSPTTVNDWIAVLRVITTCSLWSTFPYHLHRPGSPSSKDEPPGGACAVEREPCANPNTSNLGRAKETPVRCWGVANEKRRSAVDKSFTDRGPCHARGS